MRNPILIEVTRGELVESAHAGAIAVVRTSGEVVAAAGDIAAPIFPRSAIKPLQAIPLVETGAAESYRFAEAELAIASGSHSGTPAHVALVQSMLARCGLGEAALACGVHEPMDRAAASALDRAGIAPSPLHHNCSGKHAGMLATAVHMGEPVEGYWRPEHPVQQRIHGVLAELCGCELPAHVRGSDGCSVPNWAMPLAGLARAFARLATGEGLPPARAEACRRIAQACWTSPEMVAGANRLDTEVLRALGQKVLLKGGAEGVCAGAFPEHGLGFALKIEDGAKRASEHAAMALIAHLYRQARSLAPSPVISNWRGAAVGRVRPSEALTRMLKELRPAAAV
jgi:L-asparaginase II